MHLLHGRPLTALASLGARTVVPVALYYGVGYGTFGLLKATGDDSHNLGKALFAVGLGALAGISGVVGAMAFDAGVLAREPAARAEPARAKSFVTDVSISPEFDAAGLPRGIALSGRLF